MSFHHLTSYLRKPFCALVVFKRGQDHLSRFFRPTSDSELFTNLIFINPRLTHVLDAAFKKLNKLLSSIDSREKDMIILLGRHVPFALLFIIRFT